jgi:hypothetical protein
MASSKASNCYKKTYVTAMSTFFCLFDRQKPKARDFLRDEFLKMPTVNEKKKINAHSKYLMIFYIMRYLFEVFIQTRVAHSPPQRLAHGGGGFFYLKEDGGGFFFFFFFFFFLSATNTNREQQ